MQLLHYIVKRKLFALGYELNACASLPPVYLLKPHPLVLILGGSSFGRQLGLNEVMRVGPVTGVGPL